MNILSEHVQTVFDKNNKELSEDEKLQFKNILDKYQNSFSKSATDIGRSELIEHTINTGKTPPIRQQP